MASNNNIKVDDNVKKALDDIAFEGESYNVTIQRILYENQSLTRDKEMLMKIAMKTDDSLALPNINHKVFFAVTQVLKDTSYSDDEKFGYLKIYLRPSLEDDSDAVLSMLESIKNDYDIESPILDKVISWIHETYQ